MYGFRRQFQVTGSYSTKKEIEDMVVGYKIVKTKVNPKTDTYTISIDFVIRKYEDVALDMTDMEVLHRVVHNQLKSLDNIERIGMIGLDSCLVKYKKSRKGANTDYWFITRGVKLPDVNHIKKAIKIIDNDDVEFTQWSRIVIK